MIKLKLSFGKDDSDRTFEIVKDELLTQTMVRVLKDVPLNGFKPEEAFEVVVNGHRIEYDFWRFTKTRENDTVLVTPRIRSGESGQIFKQVAIIAITVVASVYLGPQAGTAFYAQVGGALAVAAVTIGATLLMNALIPPPVPKAGDISGSEDIDKSQMYAITGQTNQMKRFSTVPKVYGTHRVFPTIAAVPYTELAVDPDTGKPIQYLYGIYDFGLGVMNVNSIQIGDTPITTDSFKDFEYNLVDLNRPEIPTSEFDKVLKNSFQFYKHGRNFTPLSTVLVDGETTTFLSDPNSDLNPQEIIIDFVAPSGLYGYSSGGVKGERSVKLEVKFALVGTSIFHAYNNTSFVSSYKSIGGTDVTDFYVNLAPLGTEDSEYYYALNQGSIIRNTVTADYPYNATKGFFIKPGMSKILVYDNSNLTVGSKVFIGQLYIGNIQSLENYVPNSAYTIVHLDRVMPNFGIQTLAYYYEGTCPNPGANSNNIIFNWTHGPLGIASARSSRHESAVVVVTGSQTTPIYGQVRFTPTIPGQYQIQVKRVSTFGTYSTTVADTLTWTGLTTAYKIDPIVTDKRHTFLEIRIKATDQLNGNIQNLSAVCSSALQVYDPDSRSWSLQLTNNPAWVFVDLLTGEVNKKAVSIDRLHLDSIVEWANYCAEVPVGIPWVYSIQTITFSAPATSGSFDLHILGEVITLNWNDGPTDIVDAINAIFADDEYLGGNGGWSGLATTSTIQFFGVNGPVDLMTISNNTTGKIITVAETQAGVFVQQFTQSRFQSNFVLDFSSTLQDLLNQVGGSAQASLNLIDGKYGVLIDRLKETPVQIFTPRNSKDFSSTRMFGPRPHAIKIKYIEPDLNWEVNEVTVYADGYTEDNATDFDELTAFSCTNNEQAWRFGRYMMAQNVLRQETMTLLVDFENLVCTRGDYVQITQDVMRVGGTPARVKNIFTEVGYQYLLNEYTLVVLDDSIDYDSSLTYNYVLRSSTGEILQGPFYPDVGKSSYETFVCSGTPTSGSVQFSYRGDTVVIAAANVGTVAMVAAMRAAFTYDDDFNFDLGIDSGLPNEFKVQYIEEYGAPLFRIEVDSSTLANGSGAVTIAGTVTEGRAPDPQMFYPHPSAMPAVGDLIVVGEASTIVFDCIVKAISPNDDMSATLTLVEKADGIWDYETTMEMPEYDPQISNTSRPDFYPPKAVENLTVADNLWECSVTKSGYAYYVDLVWDIPAGSVFEFFQIWVNEGSGYKAVDTCHSAFYRYEVDQTLLGIEHKFKVVAVSSSGKKLELVAMPEVTATPEIKSDSPSDVEDFAMSITNQVLQLTWSALDDCDVSQYVIRYSPDTNDVWESSVPLAVLSKNVTSATVQARTGVYLIKAIDFAGNQSANAAIATTTIPSLFDLNIIEEINDAPDFDGTLDQIELLGEAVILQEQVPGDVDDVVYYAEGFYTYLSMLDLGDIYSVRLQSLVRADGLRKGELMSEWVTLESIDHLNTSLHSDWDVALQYRATDVFAAMSGWASLAVVDHINYGAGVGFTEWRDLPTTGDVTGRIFQFRVRMSSYTPNVTPRLFDATIKADMPDRTDSYENQLSTASGAYVITYDPIFKGPGTSPNIQISVDNGQTGDYWTFDYKTLEALAIRFYDKNGIQVARQFDLVAKGYGHRHTSSL